MKNVIITQDFKFAERGIEVIEYTASPDVIEVSDECAEVALIEKWAVPENQGRKGRRITNPTPDIIDRDFEKQKIAEEIQTSPEAAVIESAPETVAAETAPEAVTVEAAPETVAVETAPEIDSTEVAPEIK